MPNPDCDVRQRPEPRGCCDQPNTTQMAEATFSWIPPAARLVSLRSPRFAQQFPPPDGLGSVIAGGYLLCSSAASSA